MNPWSTLVCWLMVLWNTSKSLLGECLFNVFIRRTASPTSGRSFSVTHTQSPGPQKLILVLKMVTSVVTSPLRRTPRLLLLSSGWTGLSVSGAPSLPLSVVLWSKFHELNTHKYPESSAVHISGWATGSSKANWKWIYPEGHGFIFLYPFIPPSYERSPIGPPPRPTTLECPSILQLFRTSARPSIRQSVSPSVRSFFHLYLVYDYIGYI